MGITDPYGEIQEAVQRTFAGQVQRMSLPKGDRLFAQGDEADAMYLLLSGRVQAEVTQEDGRGVVVAVIGPGELVGETGILVGRKRSATVRAAEDAELLRMPRAAVERVARDSPQAIEELTRLARRSMRRRELAGILPALFGPLDEAALRDVEAGGEWLNLRGGEFLFRQGEAGDSLYIVVSGRLRAVAGDEGGAERTLNEIGRGQSIGEIAILTEEPRSASVYAIRDSELLRISKPAFARIVERRPVVMANVAKLLIARLRRSEGSPRAPAGGMNIALIPAGPDVPLARFAERLAGALSALGACLHLSSRRLENILGLPGLAEAPQGGELDTKLLAWLDRREAEHRFIIYEAEASASPWTQRCIRQADRIVLVAEADGDARPGEIETQVLAGENRTGTASRMLVLLHADGRRLPSNTQSWLSARNVEDHCHVCLDADADFARLSRLLAGCAVGLVLGGGGARGLAHIGVIRALREAGVPIDLIGGTSMGAIIAAQHAMGWDHAAMIRLNTEMLVRARPFREYALPILSIIRGRRLDRAARTAFRETRIEDLWVSFFCVSSNLTTTEMVVHRDGLLRRALRASGSLPGVLAPVPEAGSLLVDGGVLNNLPGDVMRELSDGPVIAVNVSPDKDLTISVPELPSPWRILWNRLFRRKCTPRLPTIADVLVRATMVGSVRRANEVKAQADLYLRPPVQQFGILEFDAIERIAEAGYRHAKAKLEELKGTPLHGRIMGRSA